MSFSGYIRGGIRFDNASFCRSYYPPDHFELTHNQPYKLTGEVHKNKDESQWVLDDTITITTVARETREYMQKTWQGLKKKSLIIGSATLLTSLAAIGGAWHGIYPLPMKALAFLCSNFAILFFKRSFDAHRENGKWKNQIPIFIEKLKCHSFEKLYFQVRKLNLKDNLVSERDVVSLWLAALQSIELPEIGIGYNKKSLESLKNFFHKKVLNTEMSDYALPSQEVIKVLNPKLRNECEISREQIEKSSRLFILYREHFRHLEESGSLTDLESALVETEENRKKSLIPFQDACKEMYKTHQDIHLIESFVSVASVSINEYFKKKIEALFSQSGAMIFIRGINQVLSLSVQDEDLKIPQEMFKLQELEIPKPVYPKDLSYPLINSLNRSQLECWNQFFKFAKGKTVIQN